MPRSAGSNYQSAIEKLKAYGIDWGWGVRRIYQDDSGVFCIRFDTPRGQVYAITKSYAYKNRYASFPMRIVRRGVDYEHPVSIFFGDEPRLGNGYVFDPEVVMEVGSENMQSTSPHKREKWVDIECECGVLMGDYISGVDNIPTL